MLMVSQFSGFGAGEHFPLITGTGTASESQTDIFSINTTQGKHAGLGLTADASGYVYQATWKVDGITSGGDYHCEVWSDNAGSPGEQIGADSGTNTVSGVGVETFTWTNNRPLVVNGTDYWLVLVPENDANNITLGGCNAVAGFTSSRNNTITSLGAEFNASYDWIAGY